MTGGINPSVSPVDTFAAHFRRINQRLATLERASGGGGGGSSGPPSDWTPYDARFVNVAGDTMTGLLRGTAAYMPEQSRFGTGASVQPVCVLGTGTTAYVAYFPNATSVDTLGTRAAYVGVVSNNLRVWSELAGSIIQFGVAGLAGPSIDADSLDMPTNYKLTFGSQVRQMIDLYATTFGIGVQSSTTYFRSSSDFSWHKGGVHSDVRNDPGAAGTERMRIDDSGRLRVNGPGDPFYLVSNSANTCFIGLYSDAAATIAAPGTRYGYMGISASDMVFNNERGVYMRFYTGTGNIFLYYNGSGAEISRIENGGQAWGRTIGTYATTDGMDIRTDGRFISTMAVASAYNWMVNISASDVAGGVFLTFRRSTTPAQIGSITQVATTGVAYNTTSHGPFKGNVQPIEDGDAIKRVMRWRPVAYQWKLDKDRTPAEDAEPSGPVEHGFIATEMHRVNPDAVHLGHGTWAQHVKWRKKFVLFQAALKLAEEWDVADPKTRPPRRPEVPDDPGDSPFLPAGGDWSRLVPDLTAAVQALVRQNRDLTARLKALENAA